MSVMSDFVRILSDVGPAIRKLRKSRRVKVQDLAIRSGKSRDTLHRLEAGGDVSVSTLLSVLAGLGFAIEIVSTGVPTLDEMRARFAHLEDGDGDD